MHYKILNLLLLFSSVKSQSPTDPDHMYDNVKDVANLPSDHHLNQEMQTILADPLNRPLPWRWTDQCYNDNVLDCGEGIRHAHRQLHAHADRVKEHLRSLPFQKHSAGQPNPPRNAKFRTMYTMAAILCNYLHVFPDEPIPYHLFIGYEFLLGIGFHATLQEETSVDSFMLDLRPFERRRGQLMGILATTGKLGLHRLTAALLDLFNVRFRQANSAELRTLLNISIEQPHVRIEILKRIVDGTLRGTIAKEEIPNNALLTAINRTLALSLKSNESACLPGHRFTPRPLHTDFMDAAAHSAGLTAPEQLLLARAFLYLSLNVPMESSYPAGEIMGLKPSEMATNILRVYCLPTARFNILD